MNEINGQLDGTGMRFGLVAARFNGLVVERLVEGANDALTRHGVAGDAIDLVRVPGAFEIPAVASALAKRSVKPVDAILCLGVILRGETTHAEHIGQAVSGVLVQLQIEHSLPVIHEVLLLENVEQAKHRCLDAGRNRGIEAARTAVEMVRVMRRIGA